MSVPIHPDIQKRANTAVKRSYGLLALMTLSVAAGPLIFGKALSGGASPRWPPDRPVEWATLAGVFVFAFALMGAIIAFCLSEQAKLKRAIEEARAANREPATRPNR